MGWKAPLNHVWRWVPYQHGGKGTTESPALLPAAVHVGFLTQMYQTLTQALGEFHPAQHMSSYPMVAWPQAFGIPVLSSHWQMVYFHCSSKSGCRCLLLCVCALTSRNVHSPANSQPWATKWLCIPLALSLLWRLLLPSSRGHAEGDPGPRLGWQGSQDAYSKLHNTSQVKWGEPSWRIRFCRTQITNLTSSSSLLASYKSKLFEPNPTIKSSGSLTGKICLLLKTPEMLC